MSSENTILGLAFSTAGMEVHQEVLVYPFESFLAEVGGALGLFLGFSLIMIWDFIIFVFKNLLFSDIFQAE